MPTLQGPLGLSNNPYLGAINRAQGYQIDRGPGAYGPANILGTLYGLGRTPTTPQTGSTPLAPGPVYGYNPAYGGVPTSPSPQGTQSQSIFGNIGSLGNLYGLSQGIGQASAAGAQAQLQSNLPGYSDLTGQSSGNIQQLLRGQIPQDVQNLIAEQAAERGVAIGSPGSPNAQAALIRSLGLTSLGLQQQGEQELTGAIGRTPVGPQFNPASMLVTPGEQQLWQYLANMLQAAPIPAAAGAANLAALGRGLGQGQGAIAPFIPSTQLPAPYQPPGFGFGTLGTYQQPADAPTGNWMQQEDGTWVNLDTGEVSWNAPGEVSQGPDYYPDVQTSSSTFPDQASSSDDFSSVYG